MADDKKVELTKKMESSKQKYLFNKLVVEEVLKLLDLALNVSIIFAVLTVMMLIYSFHRSLTENKVAAIHVGTLWEYPMVKWVNSPKRFEENAKYFRVASLFINAKWEKDYQNFTQLSSDQGGVYQNRALNNILEYVYPEGPEYPLIQRDLLDSQFAYKIAQESQIKQRFLIDEMEVESRTPNSVTMKVYGRFEIFSLENRSTLPIEDLGYKVITLVLVSSQAIFDTDPNGTLQPRNPEGWLVYSAERSSLNAAELRRLKEKRLLTGMEEIF